MVAQCKPAGAHLTRYRVRWDMARRQRPRWEASQVRELRDTLGLTQRAMAQDLGVRQQTISDWETGAYAPRGASVRLLDLVAERAGFRYGDDDGSA